MPAYFHLGFQFVRKNRRRTLSFSNLIRFCRLLCLRISKIYSRSLCSLIDILLFEDSESRTNSFYLIIRAEMPNGRIS